MGHQRFYLELDADHPAPTAEPWPDTFSLQRELADVARRIIALADLLG